MAGKRSFGSIRKLKSGRFQARYTGPDGAEHKAATTFSAQIDAEGWLVQERRFIEREEWTPPAERAVVKEMAGVTLREYADAWLEHKDLTPKTRALYKDLLTSRIFPGLGDMRMTDVDLAAVRAWWRERQADATPTRSAHAYQVLKGVFNAAVADDTLPSVEVNPCRVEGAGKRPKRREIELLTVSELNTVTAAMPESYRAAVPLTAWCGLRFGELIELRRKDVVVRKDGTVLKIRRAATLVDGKIVQGLPKSDAGIREVHVPPHVAGVLAEHMRQHTGRGPDALLFRTTRGSRLSQSAFTKTFKIALAEIGKESVRVHDLRHVGAVLAAQAGATTKELMGRLGHSTPEMSMRYQHVAAGRDAEISRRMSEMASGH